jgi:hypothetical protein
MGSSLRGLADRAPAAASERQARGRDRPLRAVPLLRRVQPRQTPQGVPQGPHRELLQAVPTSWVGGHPRRHCEAGPHRSGETSGTSPACGGDQRRIIRILFVFVIFQHQRIVFNELQFCGYIEIDRFVFFIEFISFFCGFLENDSAQVLDSFARTSRMEDVQPEPRQPQEEHDKDDEDEARREMVMHALHLHEQGAVLGMRDLRSCQPETPSREVAVRRLHPLQSRLHVILRRVRKRSTEQVSSQYTTTTPTTTEETGCK